METIKLYDTAAIECIAGDTITGINIDIENTDINLADYIMTCVVSSKYNPTTAITTIDCTATETGFTATLTGEVTAAMNGMYYLDFSLNQAGTDAQLKGARVLLNVLKSPV